MNFGFGEHARLARAAWRLARQFPSEENRRAADFGTRAACAPHPQSIFCGMAVIYFPFFCHPENGHSNVCVKIGLQKSAFRQLSRSPLDVKHRVGFLQE